MQTREQFETRTSAGRDSDTLVRAEALPAPRRESRIRAFRWASALLVALTTLVALPLQGHAVTLVSTLGQDTDLQETMIDSHRIATKFTVGPHSGFTVTSVIIKRGSGGQAINMAIHAVDTSNTDNPVSAALYSFTRPSTNASGNRTFTAPSGATMTEDTSYFVVMRTSASSSQTIPMTHANAEDGGGITGWSVADSGRKYDGSAWSSSGTFRMKIQGTGPELSFPPGFIAVDEEDGPVVVTVNLDPASTGTVSVDYATLDSTTGRAKEGDDYTATSGTVTFAPGETSKTITVEILSDDIYEGPEGFLIELSNPSGATLSVYPSKAVQIASDDAVPTASMAPVTVDEGAGAMTLTLRLSHPSHEDIAYIAGDDNVTGTATEFDDYDRILRGVDEKARITVAGGNLSQTFDISIVDDDLEEPDETGEDLKLTLRSACK